MMLFASGDSAIASGIEPTSTDRPAGSRRTPVGNRRCSLVFAGTEGPGEAVHAVTTISSGATRYLIRIDIGFEVDGTKVVIDTSCRQSDTPRRECAYCRDSSRTSDRARYSTHTFLHPSARRIRATGGSLRR